MTTQIVYVCSFCKVRFHRIVAGHLPNDVLTDDGSRPESLPRTTLHDCLEPEDRDAVGIATLVGIVRIQ